MHTDENPGPDDDALTILLAPDTTVTHLVLAGELDMATEPKVVATVARLRAAGPRHVLLDLSRLTFCDARGLAAIAAVHDDLAAAGMRLTLLGAPCRLRRLMAVTGLDEQLDLGAATDR